MAAGLSAWCGSASAQSFGIYVGPPAYDSYYSYYGPAYSGPRVYGYTRYYDDDVAYPSRSGGCGTYYFWNGERCVDARNRSRPLE